MSAISAVCAAADDRRQFFLDLPGVGLGHVRRKRHHRLPTGPAHRAGVLRHGSAPGMPGKPREIGTAVARRAAAGWRIANKPWVRSGHHRPCRQGLERPGPALVPWPDAGCLRILVRLGYRPPRRHGVAAAGQPGIHPAGTMVAASGASRLTASLPIPPRHACRGPARRSPAGAAHRIRQVRVSSRASWPCRWQAAGPRPGLRLACLWRSVGGERGPGCPGPERR
jgi:hypothetical protein